MATANVKCFSREDAELTPGSSTSSPVDEMSNAPVELNSKVADEDEDGDATADDDWADGPDEEDDRANGLDDEEGAADELAADELAADELARADDDKVPNGVDDDDDALRRPVDEFGKPVDWLKAPVELKLPNEPLDDVTFVNAPDDDEVRFTNEPDDDDVIFINEPEEEDEVRLTNAPDDDVTLTKIPDDEVMLANAPDELDWLKKAPVEDVKLPITPVDEVTLAKVPDELDWLKNAPVDDDIVWLFCGDGITNGATPGNVKLFVHETIKFNAFNWSIACPGVKIFSTASGKAEDWLTAINGMLRLPEATKFKMAEWRASIVVIEPISCCKSVSVTELAAPT